jgi:hypothetical protein
MITAIVGAVTGLAGLVFGYLIRLNEFRRNRRLVAYSEFVGAFLATAHSGATLFSIGVQQGERFWAEENRDENSELWRAFGAAAQDFETATARLRLVGSDPVRTDSEALEDFITQNIRNVEPLRRGSGVSAGGAAARVGPSEVDVRPYGLHGSSLTGLTVKLPGGEGPQNRRTLCPNSMNR